MESKSSMDLINDSMEQFDLTLLDSGQEKIPESSEQLSDDSITFTFLCKNIGATGSNITGNDHIVGVEQSFITQSNNICSKSKDVQQDEGDTRHTNEPMFPRCKSDKRLGERENFSSDNAQRKSRENEFINDLPPSTFARDKAISNDSVTKSVSEPPRKRQKVLSQGFAQSVSMPKNSDTTVVSMETNTTDSTNARSLQTNKSISSIHSADMLTSLTTQPSKQVFIRERRLQWELEQLQPTHDVKTRELSDKYVDRALTIEIKRFYTLSRAQTQKDKAKVNAFFDSSIHQLLDKLEHEIRTLNRSRGFTTTTATAGAESNTCANMSGSISNKPTSGQMLSNSQHAHIKPIAKATGVIRKNTSDLITAGHTDHNSRHSEPPSGYHRQNSRHSEPSSGYRRHNAVSVLEKWYQRRKHYPYVTPSERQNLALQCNLNVSQVENWIAKRRMMR